MLKGTKAVDRQLLLKKRNTEVLIRLLIAAWDRSCTLIKEGDESINFRKVIIESLFELEWSIAGIPLDIDQLFQTQRVEDSSHIKAILPTVDWPSDKGVIHSLLGDLGQIRL